MVRFFTPNSRSTSSPKRSTTQISRGQLLEVKIYLSREILSVYVCIFTFFKRLSFKFMGVCSKNNNTHLSETNLVTKWFSLFFPLSFWEDIICVYKTMYFHFHCNCLCREKVWCLFCFYKMWSAFSCINPSQKKHTKRQINHLSLFRHGTHAFGFRFFFSSRQWLPRTTLHRHQSPSTPTSNLFSTVTPRITSPQGT